jgi:hypothetical protein
MRRGQDPLAVLARLRGIAVMEARRSLAEEATVRADAEERERAAGRALRDEARHAGAEYAAWLPRGLAEREAAGGELRIAEARVAEATAALGDARAAERSVERLAELREEEARRLVQRAEQRALDEAGARGARRGDGPER